MKHIIKAIYGDIQTEGPIIFRSVSTEISKLGFVVANKGERLIAIKGTSLEGYHIDFEGVRTGEYAPASYTYHEECPWIIPLLTELFKKAEEHGVEIIDLRARTEQEFKEKNFEIFKEN